ncbi:TonB-dependent receptor [uncultured Sunxiuqinia sp.]|uniref:TonB-dependent receptor n=1 Tax=uncultured Sunxiuqinia sp. TaxID=1573825 RepID=UPI0026313D9C|nr:TonB-dependent receptor [uncultured Sunxiuqinia sp.]
MKLVCLFMLVAFMQVSAASYAQKTKLNVSGQNLTIEKALEQIEDQTDFSFFYNNQEVDLSRVVSLDLNNQTVEQVLDFLITESGLNYTINNKLIVIHKAQDSRFSDLTNQKKEIIGKVTDASGSPLPGVTVVVKGTTQGTISDFDGNYILEDVPADGVLVFSFVGMRTQEIEVVNKAAINVVMIEDAIGIEEVVAVGYGTQKKVNLTGAVEHLTADVLENKPVANVGQALQGVIPNLNISVANGNPNSNPSFNIRGGTSFSGNSFQSGSPLILVDGVEMDINRLNPEDIESISVIKDASAAAIYGARGTYGVMLVTTKKGSKNQAPSVSYSGSYQVQVPREAPDLLNSLQYQQAYMNAKILDGGTPNSLDETTLQHVKDYFENPETAPNYFMNGNSIVWVGNTDSYNELMRDYTPMHKHTLSVSGGGDNSTYYASLGYKDQKGIMDAKTDENKRYNAILGITSDITDWFNVDLKATYSQIRTAVPTGGSGLDVNYIFTALANDPERNLFSPVQVEVPEEYGGGIMFTDNKVGYLRYGNNDQLTQSEDMMLRVGTTFKVINGLDVKADFSYKSYNSYVKTVQPVMERIYTSWENPSTVHTYPGYVQKNYNNSDKYAINAYANYDVTLADKHQLSGVAGFNQEWYVYKSLWAKGEHLLTDDVPVLGMTTGETKYFDDGEGHWAIRGAFFRINYNYNGKYLFEMNGRYDGTSKFPTADRFQFFPSFSAGWRISEESFMASTRNVLNNLKLRASYGSLGNQNVANYAYIPSYGVTDQVPHIFNGDRPKGITPPGLVSASLTWETATTTDFGVDATLFDKLNVSFDWYNRTTSDILTAAEQLPAVLGTGVPNKNAGKMKTTGWEFSAKYSDRLSNGLKYNLAFVLSDYQSEIVKFDQNPEKLLSSLYVGKKMGEIWGYETVGIFQTSQDIENAPDQSKVNSGVWRPGDVQYANLNDDEVIDTGLNTVDDPGDRRIIGNSTPRYQFGLNTDLSWKNFDFNMFWQGVGKRDYWISSPFYWGMISGGTGTVWGLNNSWTEDNPNAFLPAYKSAGKNMQVQTRYLQNAAYGRLKNLTLGYTVPKNITEKIDVSKARIYLSGYNLLEITKIPDVFDPEVMTGTYPMMTSYILGLQVTF